MGQTVEISLEVNGEIREGEVEPRLLLADYLRENLGLTGTHLGCEHGVCGACTVLVDDKPVRSCTMFAAQADGAKVTTVEGLAVNVHLTPLQQAFREHHALQCGFCTPGFLMTATALLEETRFPTRDQIKAALTGNLCRCTGYSSIVDAVEAASAAGNGVLLSTSGGGNEFGVAAKLEATSSNGADSSENSARGPMQIHAQVHHRSDQLGSSMRAMLFTGSGRALEPAEVPVPSLGRHDALVRVQAGGVCHTELHFLDAILTPAHTPIILGHEVAGDVIAVGDEVTTIVPGQRVVAHYYATCGICKWCRTGRENLCPNVQAQLGFTVDGGYAEYVRIPAPNLVSLPMEISYEDGATLGCSGTTALHATRAIAEIRAGETALIYGAGGVGLAVMQMCKISGARTIVVDRVSNKLQLAKALGADELIDADGEDVPQAVHRITSGDGVDAAFELVGIDATIQNSLKSLGKRGRLVFIGYSRDTLHVSPLQLVIGEQQIRACVGNTLPELVDVVELVRRGKIKAVVSDVCGLEAVNEMLDMLAHGQVLGRAVFRP